MLEQSVKKLARNFNDAWARSIELLTHADEIEIERAIRTLQVIKGKTYAKALLKENGRVINDIGFDIGIGLMFRKHNISRAELNRWYNEAEKTRFEGHIFQPLPDKADAWKLFLSVREKLFEMHRAAEELRDLKKKSLLPAHTSLTIEGVKSALELGMWKLFFPEQKQEAFTLLLWQELPKEARLDFFQTLSLEEKSRIYQLPDPAAREAETQMLFDKLIKKQAPVVQQQQTSLNNVQKNTS